MGKNAYVLMLLAGSFGLAAAGSPTLKILATILRASATPAQVKVADAGEGRWVQLTDARLQCDKRSVYKDSTTFFLATDGGAGPPFVAQFVGSVSCETAQANVNGAFIPVPLGPNELNRYGIDAEAGATLRLFTETQAPRYLRLVLLPLGIVLLIAVGLFAVGLRGVLR